MSRLFSLSGMTIFSLVCESSKDRGGKEGVDVGFFRELSSLLGRGFETRMAMAYSFGLVSSWLAAGGIGSGGCCGRFGTCVLESEVLCPAA